MASAETIRATARPLLEDPPGRVRMIALWGEPGAHEPTLDTPVTFLGVDGAWRDLTARDLGDERGYVSAGDGTLSPDGSRWVGEWRGWNRMMDFRTVKSVRLVPGPAADSMSWSPDSRAVALWSIRKPGIKVFARNGRHLATLPVNVKKRYLAMPTRRQVTIFDTSRSRVRFTTYELDGTRVERASCPLPSGYPPRNTGVNGYDGTRLWISALADTKRWVYRHSIIDTATGSVTHDVEHVGAVPYIDKWTQPGFLVTGILGKPDGIYAIDPTSGEMSRISRIRVYRDQEGYENHATSEFATDLIFAH